MKKQRIGLETGCSCDELRSAAASAAWWGQWEHEEWAALPQAAIDWLSRLLARVEQGAQWPQQTRWGKALVLSTVEGVTTDPMDFRILLILPRFYRRRAGLRLRDVAPWVQQLAAAGDVRGRSRRRSRDGMMAHQHVA